MKTATNMICDACDFITPRSKERCENCNKLLFKTPFSKRQNFVRYWKKRTASSLGKSVKEDVSLVSDIKIADDSVENSKMLNS